MAGDFVVDYALLQSIQSTMNRLKGEFEGIDAVQHSADWGDGGIAGAMGSFASNWHIHREKMLGSMEAMAKNAGECMEQTRNLDGQLAHGLGKK